MILLTRIRIVILAIMVFGAFANFAQNGWGNTVIIVSQFLVGLTFYTDAVIHLLKRIRNKQAGVFNWILLLITGTVMICNLMLLFGGNDVTVGVTYVFGALLLAVLLVVDSCVFSYRVKRGKDYTGGVYENVFLFFCFQALTSKNMHMMGASLLLITGVAFLVPFYIIQSISFLRKNYHKGKGLVVLLSIGCLTTVMLGIGLMFKAQHWPGANIMFYSSLCFTLVMIIGTLKWKYRYEDKNINVIKGFSLLRSHIVLLYYSLFIFACYTYMMNLGLAPKFYSQSHPAAVDKFRDGTADGESRSNQLLDAYDAFLEKSADNGFFK